MHPDQAKHRTAAAFCVKTVVSALLVWTAWAAADERPRARDLGIDVGTLTPGPLNAITDVPGVRVGQSTIIRGDSVRTGVTVIFPHSGNPFDSRVPAAVVVALRDADDD